VRVKALQRPLPDVALMFAAKEDVIAFEELKYAACSRDCEMVPGISPKVIVSGSQ
jgi:hypothetical protein